MASIKESNIEEEEIDFQPDESHALGVFGGILTIISTIVGGGIVGLPFCFYMLGLWPGLAFMLIMAG